MKRIILLTTACALFLTVTAQQDTIPATKKNDTLRIGNILIIKKGSNSNADGSWNHNKGTSVVMGRNHDNKSNSRISTNWFILDLGFANYSDQTDYAGQGTFLRGGAQPFNKNDFKLRTGKSMNVNIWFFMQRLSIVKRNVNLKYGLGLELNNYRFKTPLSFKENGVVPYTGGLQSNAPFVFRDSIAFSKNKLAADYLTVPLMLNFATSQAANKKGLSVSVGVSAGYLYSQRNKQKSDERGKEKNKGEYDLERFKLSYIGELGIGPVKLYGSYSPKSMFENELDLRPFTVGIRLSNW
jgi:hypothetical protein